MKVLTAFLTIVLLTLGAFAQQQARRHIQAFTIDYAYPLLDEQGGTSQWIVPVFSGFYDKGTWDGSKRDTCKNAIQCYFYDGRDNWKFVFSGLDGCTTQCQFLGTGVLKAKLVPIGKSAFTKELSANLTGVFIDEQGNQFPATAQYNCDLVVTANTEINLGNTLAAGNLDIVFQLN